MYLNTGSGSIVIFEVKLTFQMLTMHGQTAFVFVTRTGVLVKVFETENVSNRGGLESLNILRLYLLIGPSLIERCSVYLVGMVAMRHLPNYYLVSSVINHSNEFVFFMVLAVFLLRLERN